MRLSRIRVWWALRLVARHLETLDGRLVVAFVPNETLERTVQRQAERKAIVHRERVVHTRRLEGQERGVEDAVPPDLEYRLSCPSALWN